jgi:hypothetical protein
MPGQFINTGTNPFGNLVLTNTANAGNLTMGNVGFTLSSSDFTYYNNGYNNTPNANISFTIAGSPGSGEGFYGPSLSANSGGNAAKSAEILAYWVANGLDYNNNAYLFNASWGAGSTVASGIVVLSFYYYDVNNTYLNIGTVDTTIPGWDTPGTNIYSTLRAVDGTYYFPATFTLYNPTVQDNDSWC